MFPPIILGISKCSFFFPDMHEQRLKQLRQKLKTLEEDDWRYPSVDKLIGLQ